MPGRRDRWQMGPDHRFIGASIATMSGSTIEQLLAMRRRIRDFNVARGLRTALLYAGGWFVQWHEGPEDAVERTWRISRSHDGHREPRIVHRSVGGGVLAEPVQIASLFAQLTIADVARRLAEIEAEQRDSELEPAQIWRRLAAPTIGCLATDPQQARRAIAVVSESTESVELIKALSERCRVPVAYQRFAGPDAHSADSGAAYVDVGCSSRRTRVQALARHALPLGLARLAFSRVDSVVLLTGARPQSREALLQACGPFARAIRPQPALHVVEHGSRHVDAVLDLIARNRL